jgi:hypothetical protein
LRGWAEREILYTAYRGANTALRTQGDLGPGRGFLSFEAGFNCQFGFAVFFFYETFSFVAFLPVFLRFFRKMFRL